MRSLSLPELDEQRDRFDRAAAATEGVDAFCSSSDWSLPAHHAFMPARTARVFAGDEAYLALMEHVAEDGARLWLPMEVVWGLGCPVLGAHARAVAEEVTSVLAGGWDWDAVVLTGLGREAPLVPALVAEAGRRFRLGVAGAPARRCVVDLGEGLEGYLSRRSRNFRRGVIRAREAVARAGLRLETAPADGGGAPTALFDRVMAVERRSWKGQEGVGLALPEMEAFYRSMIARLAVREGLSLTFARDGDEDVGYILGALFAGTYRGLQFSYDDRYQSLGLGNALQLHTMETAAARGIGLYDLGAEVEYKYRWCDRVVDTITLVVRR